MTEVSLEFIAQQLERVLAEMRSMRDDLAAIRALLDRAVMKARNENDPH